MFFSYGKEGEENRIDFILKMNQSRIKCCKSIVQEASQVLSKYLINHPNSQGCSCEIKKLTSEAAIDIIKNLFSGEEILIDNDNVDILNDISKNLKMAKLYNQVSLFQRGNFSDEIKIENLLLSINSKNFHETVESLTNFDENVISHIFLGVCISQIRKPKKINLLLNLFDELDKKVLNCFIHHLLNLINHSKKNSISNESEVSFLLYQLCLRKKIDQLSIQTFRNFPLNFSDVISNSQVIIDKSLIKQYSADGFSRNAIYYSLRVDDIETFSQISESVSNFDYMQKIERSPFESCEFVNKGCYLIEYSAFFGNVKCFKYLAEKYTILPFNLAKFAVAGGNDEIIKICDEHNCNFENTLTCAIQYHNQKLVEWLILEKCQTVTLSNLSECIEYGNFTALQYFVLTQNKEIVDFTVAAKYNLSDFIVQIASAHANMSSNASSLSISGFNENDFLQNIKNKKILMQIACQNGNENVFDLFHNLSGSSSTSSSTISSPRTPRGSPTRGVSLGVNSVSMNGVVDESLFIAACKGGNVNIVKKIVNGSKSLDVYETLLKGLFSAVGHSNNPVLIQFLYDKLNEKKKVDLEVKVKEQTLLFKACKRGNFKVVDFFLRKGAYVNSINGRLGCTPLYIACLNGKTETVMTLIKNRTRPELNVRATENLQTPLHAACEFGSAEIVEFLLTYPLTANEVNCNLYDSKNRAPIHIACMKRMPEIVRLLVKKSLPSLNVRCLKEGQINSPLSDRNSQVPLEIAVESGDPEIVSLLLGFSGNDEDDDANSSSSSNDSDTSDTKSYASKYSSKKSDEKNMIKTPCKVTPEIIYTSVLLNNSEMLKVLIRQKNFFMNIRSKESGVTPLTQAVLNSNPQMVRLLISQSLIDINSKNSDGSTALHAACKSGDLPIINMLLKHELIDINLKDENGNTPIHLASQNGHLEATKLLINHGDSEINRINSLGQSPIDVAANNQIKNLLQNGVYDDFDDDDDDDY